MSEVAAAAVAVPKPSKALHVTLWVLQVLLGAAFALAGAGKAFQPMEALATSIPWTVEVGAGLTRFIGVSELLGGLGLILPAATRILPKLTPLAAAGLALVMVLAAAFHAARAEWAGIGVNVVLGGIAAFIAWGRLKKAPIAAR